MTKTTYFYKYSDAETKRSKLDFYKVQNPEIRDSEAKNIISNLDDFSWSSAVCQCQDSFYTEENWFKFSCDTSIDTDILLRFMKDDTLGNIKDSFVVITENEHETCMKKCRMGHEYDSDDFYGNYDKYSDGEFKIDVVEIFHYCETGHKPVMSEYIYPASYKDNKKDWEEEKYRDFKRFFGATNLDIKL